MSRQLAAWVYVAGQGHPAGSTPPDEVAVLITNPDAWAGEVDQPATPPAPLPNPDPNPEPEAGATAASGPPTAAAPEGDGQPAPDVTVPAPPKPAKAAPAKSARPARTTTA